MKNDTRVLELYTFVRGETRRRTPVDMAQG